MNPLIQFVTVITLLQAPVGQELVTPVGPVRPPEMFAPLHTQQQQQKKAQLVEYSDAYMLRATIHKYSSYTMLPVFALQYYSGTLLLRERDGWQYAPDWAHKIHGPLAIGTAGLFTVNTVTGVWNLWEAREDPEDRTRRRWHAWLMMAADAGFVATAFLAPKDGPPPPVPVRNARHWHRTVAFASMGAAAVSYTIMLPFFRKD
ncbi:MAG: hypothetical protein ACRENP_28555 [Longimicrobiales bacterium]